jgi:hypothetical protein
MSRNSIADWVNMYCGGHWADSLEFAALCARRMDGRGEGPIPAQWRGYPRLVFDGVWKLIP